MKRNRMTILTILYFVIAALLTATAVSFAAYTSLSSVKRVVTVKGTEQLFTSDLLIEYENADLLQPKIVSLADKATTKSFTFVVSNHIQGDATKYDTHGIEYSLVITLKDLQGNVVEDSDVLASYKIGTKAMTSGTVTLANQTLTNAQSEDRGYTIFLPETGYENYKISITAVPKAGSHYRSLGRVISFATETTANHWTSKFMEPEKTTVAANKELAMINIMIYGQLEEQCVLSWDSSKVAVDAWFLEKMGVTPTGTDGGTKSATLNLGALGTPEQYIITFYRTYAAQDLTETWDEVQSYITFTNTNP